MQVERVDQERLILDYLPLDAIPGLLVDDKLVSQRTVPDIETLLDWLEAIPAIEKP